MRNYIWGYANKKKLNTIGAEHRVFARRIILSLSLSGRLVQAADLPFRNRSCDRLAITCFRPLLELEEMSLAFQRYNRYLQSSGF
jgi:hypothetical protein